MRDDDLGNADEQAAEDTADRSVGTLELFFDLVFVYAMSQVTALMLEDISWAGFGRGILALAAVWWAWACYAWLTNTSDHDGPGPRLLLFLAMAAMLMAAVETPGWRRPHWLMAAAAVAVGAWLGGMATGLRRARMPIYDVAVPDGDSERT